MSDDLLGELFIGGACADEDGGVAVAVVDVGGEFRESIGGPMLFGFRGADAEDDVWCSVIEAIIV